MGSPVRASQKRGSSVHGSGDNALAFGVEGGGHHQACVFQRWYERPARRIGAHQFDPEFRLIKIVTVIEWPKHAAQGRRCGLKPPSSLVLEPGDRGLRTRGLAGRFVGSRVGRARAIVGLDRRANQPNRECGGADEQSKEDQGGDAGHHGGTTRLLLLLQQRGLRRVDEVLLIGGGSLSRPLSPSPQEFEFGGAP